MNQIDLNGQVAVFFRAVLDSDEHRHAIDIGVPREVVPLPCAGREGQRLRFEVTDERIAKLRGNRRIGRLSPFRAMKSRRSIALPIVNVATAHELRRTSTA